MHKVDLITLNDWQTAYLNGANPRQLLDNFQTLDTQDTAWITPMDAVSWEREIQYLELLLTEADGDKSRLPLYGIPYAVKDNIDVKGWPTTAACPAFSYVADRDATVVARLRAAGAVMVGKTNLDQFATGLVGVRSPYGAVQNTFNIEYVSGGSSSGSASVVSRCLVPFSLGTDTAGSGRVPAAFNNIVGLKPTKGWFSTFGVVPACRTLDCVSIFALTVDDASEIAELVGGFDVEDSYSREFSKNPVPPLKMRMGYPAQLEFFGDTQAEAVFQSALQHLQALGVEVVAVDFAPFKELASLLYQGPWVAERLLAARQLYETNSQAIHPVIKTILDGASRFSAADAFSAEYHRAFLARRIQNLLLDMDVIVVPTTPSIYKISEIESDPINLNSRLGIYTNFTNLADLSALALPAGWRDDGLPSGITLIGSAWQDRVLVDFGRRWQQYLGLTLGNSQRVLANLSAPKNPVSADHVRLAVVGAHLRGMPLNHQLTSRAATYVETCFTAPCYQLYALANTSPAKPGLVKANQGKAIEVELWDVPIEAFGSFVAAIAAPLGIGTLVLEDGRQVKGFICESAGLEGAVDITVYGGWRAYMTQCS